nr:MAG TPA: hypothetical protein [Caudoviricetes sp.]
MKIIPKLFGLLKIISYLCNVFQWNVRPKIRKIAEISKY